MQQKGKASGNVVAIVAIIAIFSIPIIAVSSPILLTLVAALSGSLELFAPLLWIGATIAGAKYLMNHNHKQKLELTEKKIELEKLELNHLQEAQKLLEDPEEK